MESDTNPSKVENTIKYEKVCENSISAIWAAIEIHNKPHISYRYEVVITLVMNAWELLMKAYILKNLGISKVFYNNGKSKSFDECLGIVFGELKKEYTPMKENLLLLQNYRNEIAHFYSGNLDVLIFSIVAKAIQNYAKFIKDFFDIDLSSDSDLVLLPIGFKKPVSPIDFLSNDSLSENSDVVVKKFITSITKSVLNLSVQGIEESVLIDYSLYLSSVRNINNSDLIVKIDSEGILGVNVNKKYEAAVLTNDPSAPKLSSRSFSESPTTEEEEIISWIALQGKDPEFLPREDSLWQKYLIRKDLKQKLTYDQIIKFVYFSINRGVAVFFWLQDMDSKDIVATMNVFLEKNTNRFVNTYCTRILKSLDDPEAKRLVNKLSKKGKSSFKKESKDSFDGAIIHMITSLKSEFGISESDPGFIPQLELKLDASIKKLAQGDGDGILGIETRELDEILYSRTLIPSYSFLNKKNRVLSE